MSLRTTLRHLKSAARGAWFCLKNWRELWGIYTDALEDPLLNKTRHLHENARECDDCDETEWCEYHRGRGKQLQREIDRELEDRGLEDLTWENATGSGDRQ